MGGKDRMKEVLILIYRYYNRYLLTHKNLNEYLERMRYSAGLSKEYCIIHLQ